MGNSSSSSGGKSKSKSKSKDKDKKGKKSGTKYEVKPAQQKNNDAKTGDAASLRPGLSVQIESEPEPAIPTSDYRPNVIQPVKRNRASPSPSPAPSPKAGDKGGFNSIPDPNGGGGLLAPNVKQNLLSPNGNPRKSPSNSANVAPNRSVSPAPHRDVNAMYSPQAGQFPTPQWTPITAEWSSFLDRYHILLLINANNATIQEIHSHYDMDGNRVLTKQELRAFAKDLVQRVLRDFAETYLKTHPKATLSLLKEKVEEEKVYLLPLPGKNQKSEEDCIKGMLQVIRSIADKNGDGKISAQELMLVFTVIMKKLFGDGTKKKTHQEGMACSIQ